MRLIDADKLNYVEDGSYIGHGMYEGHYDVSNAPTIDAIPVGWLKTHGSNLVTKPDRKFTSENMAFLYTLIAEWREMNEQRKNR